MASGTLSLGKSKQTEGRLIWTATANGTAANTSTVTAELQVRRWDGNYTTTGTWRGQLTIGGTTETFSFFASVNGWTTVKTMTVTVNHNSDGSGTCYIYGSVSGPTQTTQEGATVSGSATVTLDKIARYASIISATNFTDESNPTIVYSNPAGEAVTSLQACITLTGQYDDIPYKPVPFTGTSYTFPLTESEKNTLRAASKNSNSLTVHFVLWCQIGESELRTSAQATMSIVNANPTLSVTVVDTSATTDITGNSSILVAGKSTARVTISAEAKKYATITSRKVEHGTQVLTADGTLSVTNNPIKITVTDSRGNSTQYTATNTIVPYFNPTCYIGNNMPETGGSFTLEVSGLFYNGAIGQTSNSITVQYRMKTAGGSYGDWFTFDSVTLSGNSYTATVNLTGLDYQTVYTFQARSIDALNPLDSQGNGGVLSAEKAVISRPVFEWSKNDFKFNVPVFAEVYNSNPQVQYAINESVENLQSVCVVEDTGASTSASDNSIYFGDDYLVVNEDTYQLDKNTMLALPAKKLTGNGSVAWKDWDTIIQGWKDNEDASMLSSKLKVRYSDDPVYLSMKLPAEPDASNNITQVIRPIMNPVDASGTYTQLINMGGVYAPNPSALPDTVVVCIGRMSLYTLSNDKNAKWELHKHYAYPDGYAMYYLPWSSMGNASDMISSSKIEEHEDYVRFTLTRDDFSPNDAHPGSIGKLLHYWDKHLKTMDLSEVKAIVAFCEVWTETEDAVGLLYNALGVDQKSSDNKKIKQCIASQCINLTTSKRIAIGHTISDALYDELRDSPNDPRNVFRDYSVLNSCEHQNEVEAMREELNLTTGKTDTCFSMLTPSKIIKQGYNLNDGVWETGYIDNNGKYENNYHSTSFRNVNYLPVEGGRSITAYYDAAKWNDNNQGKGFRLVQYDSTKTLIGTYSILPAYVGGGTPLTLDANTAYIRIGFNTWGAEITTPLKDIKIAIYYAEDARREFIEYGVGGEVEYGVDGDSVYLTEQDGTKITLTQKMNTFAPGSDGENGISATHSWNGTVLTITSASGTSSADLKGSKGDKGDKGEQGIQGEPGAKGDKGDKGDAGVQGEPGKDGTPATHSWNGTVLTVTSASGTSSANLKGEKGDKGDKGDTGATGSQGEPGKDGAKGDKGDTGAAGASGKDGTSATHSWNGTTLTITSASGTSSANLKGDKGDKGDTGAKGDKGDTGAQGIQGIQGEPGAKGDKGDTGATGKTAYQYAQEGGYTETETIFSQKLGSLETIILPTTVLVPGINLNDGVWEAGYFDATTGAAVTGTAGQSFRNANYLPVTGGRSIAIYYDAATWSGTNVYRAFYVVQYDSNKNFVAVSKHSGTGPYTPSGGVICTLQPNTAYIRISMNKWSALGQDLSTIKVAVYYVEDFVKEFVEYGYGSEATYGVASDKVFLTSPNGTLYALSVGDDGTLSVKLFGL